LGTRPWSFTAEVLFEDPGKNELRITSLIRIEDLRKALEAQSIYLRFTLDETPYTALAPKIFLINKEAFLSHVQSQSPD
jgi:hypothetical protein